jgi:PAS domain S-box-containing protein
MEEVERLRRRVADLETLLARSRESLEEARRSEEELRKSEERFRHLTENAGAMIYRMMLPEGRYEYVSPASLEVMGYTPAELMASPMLIREIIHPDWRPYFDEQYAKLLAGEMPPVYEYQIIDKAGAVRWMSQRNTLVRDSDGDPVAIEGIVTDVTELKRAELALREGEAKFSTVFRSTPEIITITSISEGRFLEVNDSFTRVTGFSRDEVIGRTTIELGIWVDPEDRSFLTDGLLTHGFVRDQDYRFQSRDGRRLHGLVSAEVIDIGGTSYLLSVIRDITERKYEERALRSMNRIQDVFLTATDDTLFHGVLEILLEEMDSPYGYFGYVDEDGNMVSPSLTKDIFDVCRMSHKTIVFPRESWRGLWGASLLEGRTLLANSGLNAPAGHIGLSRALCVPILLQGEVIGQFAVANKPTDYDEDDQALLERMAAFVGPTLKSFLERKREEGERRKAEQSLRESEERFASFMRHMPGFAYIKDQDRRILFVNDLHESQLGIALPRWIGRRTEDFWTSDAGENMRVIDEQVLDEGRPVGLVEDLPIKGEARTFRTIKFPIPRPEGATWIGGISIDITEHRRAEMALRQSEALFRRLVESAPVGILIASGSDRSVLALNANFTEVYGYGIGDIPNIEQWWPRAYPDESYLQQVRGIWEGLVDRARASGTGAGPMEVWITCKDRSRRYASVFLSQLGEIDAVFFIDLTERKRAEEALRENEAKYRTLVEHLPQHVFVKDRGLVYLSCNQRFARAIGHTVGEVIGRTDHDLFPSRQDAEKYREDDRRVMELGMADLIEEQYDDGEGERRWVRTTKVPFRNDVGDVIGVVGIFEDITDWREAQERLQLSEERYRAVSDLSSDFSFAFRIGPERSLNLEWMTDAFSRMTGISVEELMAPNAWLGVVYPEDLPLLLDVLEELQAGYPVHYDARLLTKSGGPLWVRTYMKPELDPRGSVVRIYGATQDITARKTAEEKIRESLREKEILLKEIHHRVKNNLQVITSLLDLQSGVIRDREALTAFHESRNRVRSMALIHEKLYRTDDIARIDMGRYTEDLVQSLIGSYGAAARVRGWVGMTDIFMDLDMAMPFGLIVNELVMNSLKHAFPDGREGWVRVALERVGGGMATLSVEDDGIGFPEGIDVTSLSSLGMTIVMTLVRQLKGEMAIRGETGTRVTVTFPMA